MSTCKFPNHLCHLRDMPGANIAAWHVSRNIKHIVLKPHPCPRALGKVSERGAISESHHWRFPSPGTLTLVSHSCPGFYNRNSRCMCWEVSEVTRLPLTLFSTNQVYPIWLIHQQKPKSGKQHKPGWEAALLGKRLPYQQSLQLGLPGGMRNAGCARGRKGWEGKGQRESQGERAVEWSNSSGFVGNFEDHLLDQKAHCWLRKWHKTESPWRCLFWHLKMGSLCYKVFLQSSTQHEYRKWQCVSCRFIQLSLPT